LKETLKKAVSARFMVMNRENPRECLCFGRDSNMDPPEFK
jgi:hypothetical protein